jgi:hypothetical protein
MNAGICGEAAHQSKNNTEKVKKAWHEANGGNEEQGFGAFGQPA